MPTELLPIYPTLTQVDKRLWRVESEIVSKTSFGTYIVKVGELTDGASVPRALWPLFPPMSEYTNAAVTHDSLYKTHAVPSVRDGMSPRQIADSIFLELLRHVGTPEWKCRAMFRAVRMFGARPWSAKR